MRSPLSLRRFASAIIAVACLAGTADSGRLSVAQQPAARVPIVIHLDGDTDSCQSTGEVAHLDPKGDNFLSVQSGPGGKPYVEIDRLPPKKEVYVCENRGGWYGVVYGAKGGEDCKTDLSAKQISRIYTGPCRSGWVAIKYINIIAG